MLITRRSVLSSKVFLKFIIFNQGNPVNPCYLVINKTLHFTKRE